MPSLNRSEPIRRPFLPTLLVAATVGLALGACSGSGDPTAPSTRRPALSVSSGSTGTVAADTTKTTDTGTTTPTPKIPNSGSTKESGYAISW
jgi:hypothetical protein